MMDEIAKLIVSGEGTFPLAYRLSNAFRDAGFGNRYEVVGDAPTRFDIVFDTAPDMDEVRAVVRTLPPDQQERVAAYGYAQVPL